MKLKTLIAVAAASVALQAQAQTVVLENLTSIELPSEVQSFVSEQIAKNCPAAMAKSSLKIVEADAKLHKVDQGIIDTYYTLSIVIPNSTNDNDEDTIDMVVLDPMISNPAYDVMELVSFEAYGWTCK